MKTRKSSILLLTILTLFGCKTLSETYKPLTKVSNSEDKNHSFEFVALGDTAYTEESYPAYKALIQKINQASPEFTIHIGDTLGYQLCTDSMYERIQQQFNEYDHPLVYTPGDNEWTDCYDKDEFDKNGYVKDVQAKYKLNRLATLRKLFFNSTNSLGKNPIKMERQSDISGHENMVENRYWYHNDVLFATIHVVGSADGLSPYSLASATESIKRRKSNVAWIKKLNEVSKSRTTKAIVLTSHAELFERLPSRGRNITGTLVRGGTKGPYAGIVYNIAKLSTNFGKPILFIHGDYHRFVIDRPFLSKGNENQPDKLLYANITRLQTYGAPELKSVKIKVEPDTPWVFSFSPLY